MWPTFQQCLYINFFVLEGNKLFLTKVIYTKESSSKLSEPIPKVCVWRVDVAHWNIDSSSLAGIHGTVSFGSMYAQISIKAATKLTNSTPLSSYSINAHLHVHSITKLQVTSLVAAARKRSHHWWLFPWPQTIPWILKQLEEWHVFVSWDKLRETLQAAPTLLSYRGYSREVCKTRRASIPSWISCAKN